MSGMELVVAGIASGVLGTLFMDVLNHLLARTGLLVRIDIGTIGRMSTGWLRGRLRYAHPGELLPVPRERLYGVITHYAIGVGLALPFLVVWDLSVDGLPPPRWALVYGVATTTASFFLVYPSLGLGAGGRRSPDGWRAPLSSLANHLFFGVGMAVAVAVL